MCFTFTLLVCKAEQQFIKVRYRNQEVNVYGCLNQKVLCIESDDSSPWIINIRDLDEEDAYRVAIHARKNGFKCVDRRILDLTRAFVLSNSVPDEVQVTLDIYSNTGSIVHQYFDKKYDLKLTYVLYFPTDESTASNLKHGIDLPPLHRWEVGKCERKIGGSIKELPWRTSSIDVAVELLGGWMVIHEQDFYVKNRLLGIMGPGKSMNSCSKTQARVQADAKSKKTIAISQPTMKDANDGLQQDTAVARKNRKQKAKTWGRKHFQEKSLEQYRSNDQRLRRKQLQEVSMLLAEMAVAYNDKGFDAVFLDGASVINTYYKIDRAAYWSKCYGNNGLAALEGDVFSQEIGTVLDSLKVVFEEAGQIDDLKSRHDKLLLQVRFGVNTLEELQLKIAVRQAFDERVEKERLFQQEERRIQAEEDKANAIRHQTIDLYHHYKW